MQFVLPLVVYEFLTYQQSDPVWSTLSPIDSHLHVGREPIFTDGSGRNWHNTNASPRPTPKAPLDTPNAQSR